MFSHKFSKWFRSPISSIVYRLNEEKMFIVSLHCHRKFGVDSDHCPFKMRIRMQNKSIKLDVHTIEQEFNQMWNFQFQQYIQSVSIQINRPRHCLFKFCLHKIKDLRLKIVCDASI